MHTNEVLVVSQGRTIDGGGGGEGVEKKIHAEGRSNCDFSESLSFRNQQYYQAQYE